MFNHLIATALICLGVANTTPISNYEQKESNLVLTTPKKENITTNYTLTLNNSNWTQQNYENVLTTNTYYPRATEEIRKLSITKSNNYINVIGNCYQQVLKTQGVDENNNTVNLFFVENYNTVLEDMNWRFKDRSEIAFIYKFTPYNYNVNTKIKIRNSFNIESWETTNTEFYIYESFYIRNIYQKVNNNQYDNWDNFLNMTISQNMCYTIQQEIENINNGYYYTKKQELIKIGNNSYDNVKEDEITLDITPNQDNYYYIEYIPVIRPTNMGGDTHLENVYSTKGTMYYNQQATLTGTNIIPDGTYEIVDIPGLMFEIIGMPFAFVSQAFNLTIFPGTPYQINIANLFLSIIAIFVFVWLIMIFIKMKSGG